MHEHTAANTEPAAASHVAFDEVDPHGAQAGHHGHHVTGWKTLLGILCLLLFFTALTVAVSQGEQWVATAWDIHVPGWINVFGAMSIAVIKATLVCMFFMQLKHDKALNSIVLLFSLFCVGLFLFFSMVDLGNRGLVSAFKTQYAVVGGNGEGLANTASADAIALSVAPKVTTGNKPLVTYWRERTIADWPLYKDEAKTQPRYDYINHPDTWGFARKYYEDPYYLGDNTERGFWHFYYENFYLRIGKTPHRHVHDEANYFASFVTRFAHEIHDKGLHVHVEHPEASDAARSRPRFGLTHDVDALLHPEAADEHAAGDHSTDTHDADHDTGDGEHDATGTDEHEEDSTHAEPETAEPETAEPAADGHEG